MIRWIFLTKFWEAFFWTKIGNVKKTRGTSQRILDTRSVFNGDIRMLFRE